MNGTPDLARCAVFWFYRMKARQSRAFPILWHLAPGTCLAPGTYFKKILNRRHDPHDLRDLTFLRNSLRLVARQNLKDPLTRVPDSAKLRP